MINPPPTMASLAFDWGDAYLLSPVRDRWAALRRDGRYFLAAGTLAELETLIIADYQKNPVPREYDPPGAGDYLDWPGPGFLPKQDRIPDGDEELDADTLITVWELRRAFPMWMIIYSTQTRTWIARTPTKIISHSCAVSLCIALALIERCERQLSRSPGWKFPLWQYDPASS